MHERVVGSWQVREHLMRTKEGKSRGIRANCQLGKCGFYNKGFTNMAGLPKVTCPFLKVIWFATVWAIKKERNSRVFQNVACDSSSMVEIVKLNSFIWLKASQTSFSYSYHDWWKNPLPCIGAYV